MTCVQCAEQTRAAVRWQGTGSRRAGDGLEDVETSKAEETYLSYSDSLSGL